MEIWFHQTHYRHFLDAVGMCHFLPYTPEQMVELVNAATGWNVTNQELLDTGVRAATMARAINLREGYDGDADSLPKRVYGGFRNNNSATGKPMDPVEVKSAVGKLYAKMGWDTQGVPTATALGKLGIAWVADVMAPTAQTRQSKRELVLA
jgi:aldehyde:ferredoxin oxidoreductase